MFTSAGDKEVEFYINSQASCPQGWMLSTHATSVLVPKDQILAKEYFSYLNQHKNGKFVKGESKRQRKKYSRGRFFFFFFFFFLTNVKQNKNFKSIMN